MQIPDPDTFLINRSDDLLGRAEERDVHPPKVLREVLVIEMAINAWIPVVALIETRWLTALIFTPLVLASTAFKLKYLKILDADAKKDWSENLAKKYAALALWQRQNGFIGRVMQAGLTAAVLALFILVPSRSMVDAVILMFFAVELSRRYLECAVPKPPARKTQFKEAHGLS